MGGRGEGRHRTRGSEPARPWGCPPALGTRTRAVGPRSGAFKSAAGWVIVATFPPREQNPTRGFLGERTPPRNSSLMDFS